LPDGEALREHHELNDAVCVLARARPPRMGRRIKDLYRPINDILNKLLAEQKEVLAPLRELASITHFDLFATTTPDSLLTQALNPGILPPQTRQEREGITQAVDSMRRVGTSPNI